LLFTEIKEKRLLKKVMTLVIFDCDFTLFDGKENLYPDVLEILNVLEELKFTLAISTHNPNILKLIERENLQRFFNTKSIHFTPQKKNRHIHKLRRFHKPKRCIFFDDDGCNIQEVRLCYFDKVECVKVEHGLCWKDVDFLVNCV